jgi:hypothetical protein
MLKLKNEWNYNSSLPVCFHVVDKQSLYLYLYQCYYHKQMFPAAVGTGPRSMQTLVSLLGAFAELRKAAIGFIMSVRLPIRLSVRLFRSVCPYGATRFALDEFSRNLSI